MVFSKIFLRAVSTSFFWPKILKPNPKNGFCPNMFFYFHGNLLFFWFGNRVLISCFFTTYNTWVPMRLVFWGEIKCSRSFRLCENWYRKRDQGIVKKGWGIIYVLINYLLWLLCVCLSVYVIVCCGKSGNCFSLFLSRRRQLNSRSR